MLFLPFEGSNCFLWGGQFYYRSYSSDRSESVLCIDILGDHMGIIKNCGIFGPTATQGNDTILLCTKSEISNLVNKKNNLFSLVRNSSEGIHYSYLFES
jgi:hypothetical protein